jgi:prolyl-tRNA synthetase
VLAKLGIRYLVDPRVAAGSAWLTGANEPGRHATNVVSGRDFTPDGTIEAVEVRAGDPCPDCADGTLAIRRGIEIGHIFQLGRRFTDVFGLDALGQDGKPARITMGSYGVGVSRAVAAIAEQHCDERGLVWPKSVAPFDVQVIPAGKGDQVAIALTLAQELEAAGLRVLLDDRPAKVSTGVRFADADLIGAPHSIVVGRGAADGLVELRVRATDERSEVALSDVVARLTSDQD